jgi:hypothetical protein
MVAWTGHPHLTLLHLTSLLWLMLMMMKVKEAEKKKMMMMMSGAYWRPPHLFWVLNDKGEGRSIKAWRPSSPFSCSVLSGKPGLSDFARQNFHLSFHFISPVDLRTLCNVWTQWFVACNNFWTSIMSINEFMFILSYSCQNVYFYYLKCNDEWCLVNMLCLKNGHSGFINRMFRFWWFCLAKSDGSVCQIGLSDLSNWTVQFWQT